MGIYSDALDDADARLRRDSLFQFRPILIDGVMHEPLVCEKRMLRILDFIGTGEQRKFFDIYVELEIADKKAMSDAWDSGDYKATLWIDEYIIENNIQVIFEKGDFFINRKRLIA